MGVAQLPLFAIDRALAAGATAIELDVHATVDGELVVCHDATVDRTTNAEGAISSFTLAELRQLDNAFWFIPGRDVTPGRPRATTPNRVGRHTSASSDRHGARDPRALPGVFLNFDIKQTAPVVEPYEAALASLLAEFGRVDGSSSPRFLDPATEAFAQFAPDVATSAGPSPPPNSGGPSTREGRCRSSGERPAVPEHFGDIVVVDESSSPPPTGRPGGARLDDQRRRVDGSALRPRGRRHHLGRAERCSRGAGGTGTQLAAGRLARRRRTGLAAPAVRTLAVVGLLLRLILRLLVRFDIRGRL